MAGWERDKIEREIVTSDKLFVYNVNKSNNKININ